MSDVNWIPFEERYFNDYQRFAKECYGQKAYQAKQQYIDWLYKENPLSLKREDFLIGVSEDPNRVVACIHKLRLRWNYQNNLIDLPALHNLMVDKNYRHGIGFMLVMASVADERHALIPGVEMPFSEFYKILKYQKVRASWYRNLLKPVRGAMSYAANKYLNCSSKERYFDPSNASNIRSENYTSTMLPDGNILEELAHLLNSQDQKRSSPWWDSEQLRWRFFHSLGPKHLLIYEKFTETVKNFAIVSLGSRHGVNVGRILAVKCSSTESLKQLIVQVSRAIKQNGGQVLHLFCADEQINIRLGEIGWKSMQNFPDTYFYHKNKKLTIDHYSFSGSAGDFGFEGIQ